MPEKVRTPVDSPRPDPAAAPASTTRFLVVNDGWNPATDPYSPFAEATLPEARGRRAGFAAMTPHEPCRKVIVKAVTTYTIVEDGGRG